jgi:WD40 repeat protein
MSDVFVSYSRRDSQFVGKLAQSIEDRGKQVWVDTEGIADAEVFPQAIRTAIEQSDAFLFVITPAAVDSSYCENEVDYARELGKRIVPVLRVAVPDASLPAEIRDRNWIPFTEQDPYEPSVERLVRALDRDLEHAREHTRWLVKAIEWDGEGRDKSFLLRGSELKAAEGWLAASRDDADPAPTPLQREYLLASREGAARRQRTLAGGSLAVALVSIGLLVFALISRQQAVSAQTIANSRALAAQSENQLAVDPELSILLGVRAVRASPTPDALFALRAAIDASPLRLTLLTPGQVNCQFTNGPSLAFDPSAPRIAEGLCGGTEGRGGVPGRLLVFNPLNGRVVSQTHLGRGGTPVVAYSPDGSLLAVATAGEVRLLDARTGASRGQLGASPPPPVAGSSRPGAAPFRSAIVLPSALAFSPDGSLLAIVTQTQARVWSPGRQTIVTLEGSPFPSNASGPLYGAAFSPDGRSVAVAGENGVRVFNSHTGAMLRALPGIGQAYAVSVSPGTDQLAVASLSGNGDGVVSLWSTRTWRETTVLARFTARQISTVAFSPNGTTIGIGAADGSAGLWSVRSHDQLVAYLGSTSALTALAFAADGTRLATASADGTTKVWRASGPELASIESGGAINAVGLAGDRLVAAIVPDVVRSWLLPAARARPAIANAVPGSLDGLILSPDASVVAEPYSTQPGAPASAVAIRSTTTGRLLRTVPAPDALTTLAVSPDGRRLAMLGAVSQTVADLTGTGTVKLQAPGGIPGGAAGCQWRSVALSRDDRLVAGANFCGGVTVWNARSGRLLAKFTNQGEISQVAFSPDGRDLAVGSWNSTITIWDVRTRSPLHVLHGHTLGVDDVAYSPNGALLASSSLDDTARVWAPSSGRLLRVWHDPAPVTSVSFAADGGRIVTGDALGTIRVWDACTACTNATTLLDIARGRVTRQLTALERATYLNG